MASITGRRAWIGGPVVVEEKFRLGVDEAHSTFTHANAEGLICRAGHRYLNADLRRYDTGSTVFCTQYAKKG